jgi:hypothetical protein
MSYFGKKQRVFSHATNVNYTDYLKNKNGVEIMKCLKSTSLPQVVSNFDNYRNFLTLSETYYRYLDHDKCKKYFIQNMYECNISYKKTETETDYNKKNQKDCNCFDDYNEQKKECSKNVLYPYGEYVTNQIANPYFPSKLDLNKWCPKKKMCYKEEEEYKEEEQDKEMLNKYNQEKDKDKDKDKEMFKKKEERTNTCKTGLCKNTKSIFV